MMVRPKMREKIPSTKANMPPIFASTLAPATSADGEAGPTVLWVIRFWNWVPGADVNMANVESVPLSTSAMMAI